MFWKLEGGGGLVRKSKSVSWESNCDVSVHSPPWHEDVIPPEIELYLRRDDTDWTCSYRPHIMNVTHGQKPQDYLELWGVGGVLWLFYCHVLQHHFVYIRNSPTVVCHLSSSEVLLSQMQSSDRVVCQKRMSQYDRVWKYYILLWGFSFNGNESTATLLWPWQNWSCVDIFDPDMSCHIWLRQTPPTST